MRKTILIMLLAVVSSSAAADWVYLGGNDTITFYADPTTIRKAGNVVKLWNLFDLKTAQLVNGKRYMSTKGQTEYDCKEERTRELYASFHSGNMARGEIVELASNMASSWTPVAPRSISEDLWKFACGKW